MNKSIDRLIWFNGEIIPQSEAKINIMTTTAQYGINVFEGLRCYFNQGENQLYAFRVNEHLERLYNSSKLMRFDLGEFLTAKNTIQNIIEIIQANGYREDLYAKIGFYLDGEGSWSGVRPIGSFIYPHPKGRVYSDKVGVDCCVVSWERISDASLPPRIKAGANYLNSRFAHLEAVRNNYDLAIFMNRYGHVSEGTGACIFIVKKGKLITPPVTASILESITRDTIIEIAKNELKFEVEERDIDRTEVYIADEMFLVGTSVEILPVLSLDRIELNYGKVGELTSKLRERYFQIAYGENSKYANWRLGIY